MHSVRGGGKACPTHIELLFPSEIAPNDQYSEPPPPIDEHYPYRLDLLAVRDLTTGYQLA